MQTKNRGDVASTDRLFTRAIKKVCNDAPRQSATCVRIRYAASTSPGTQGVIDVELMTAKDVATALRISSRQIWKLASAGRLPQPVKLLRSTRWRKSDIDQFVQLDCNMAKFEAATGGKAVAAR
ncbi:MAG: helix-turn-helix domain-containing protein [Planctomycetes bacterium]|nr:helix-turn-helix domain-containing protein [Planctomycetota bacterium]MBI3835814.1 helix-turn-helix domain-containing protein [Planctomycetota bacterium]